MPDDASTINPNGTIATPTPGLTPPANVVAPMKPFEPALEPTGADALTKAGPVLSPDKDETKIKIAQAKAIAENEAANEADVQTHYLEAKKKVEGIPGARVWIEQIWEPNANDGKGAWIKGISTFIPQDYAHEFGRLVEGTVPEQTSPAPAVPATDSSKIA